MCRGRLRPLMPVEIKPGDIIAFGLPPHEACCHRTTLLDPDRVLTCSCTAGTLQTAYRVVQALAAKDFKW